MLQTLTKSLEDRIIPSNQCTSVPISNVLPVKKESQSPNRKNNLFLMENYRKLDKMIEVAIIEEFKRENSIFKEVKDDAILMLSSFLLEALTRPVSIALAGETASGKSTITNAIVETLNNYAKEKFDEEAVVRINADDYYYDRSEMVKAAGSFAAFAKNYDLDSPAALELELMQKNITELTSNNPTYLPKYDMSGTAIRIDKHHLAEPKPVIIAEGLFVLNKKVSSAFDLKIFVDIDEDVKKERFYRRAQERNLGNSADEVYKNATEKAKFHVLPTKKHADIILSGEAEPRRYQEFVLKILNIVEQYRNETLCLSGVV